MPKKVEISHKTIIFTVFFLLALWLVFQIREVILGLFVSLILMSALNPLVKKLERLRIPRSLAIIFIYLIVLAFLAFGIGGIVPPLIEQTSTLISQVPNIFNQFKILGVDEKIIASQLSQFSAIPVNLVQFIINLFSNILTIFGMAVITFYLLLERRNLDHYLVALLGNEREKIIGNLIDKIESKLGGWVRAELFLMTFIGLLSYFGYRLIGVQFALPLAILAFLLEIVPNIGPTVAAIPAVLLALVDSPTKAIVVVAWAFFVQQLENSIIVPKIMKKTIGVNPLVSLLFLTIGFKIAGMGGAMLAIPVYLVLEVISSEIFSSNKFKDQ